MTQHALFIGVNKYGNGIQPLNCARNDAEQLWSLFSQRANFARAEKLVDEEAASADVVRQKAKELVADLKRGDLFVFYFSGHGVPYLHRQLLVLADAKHVEVCNETRKDPPLGTVALDTLLDETEGEFERVFLLDMCRAPLQAGQKGIHSGFSTKDLSLGPSHPGKNRQGSWTIVFSCDEKQHSVEIADTHRGLFSLALSSLVKRRMDSERKVLLDGGFMGAMENEMAHIARENGIDPEGQRPQLDLHGDPIILVTPFSLQLEAAKLFVCPTCGKNNRKEDTFRCKGCGRENLCMRHQDERSFLCGDCEAERARKAAETAVAAARKASEEQAEAAKKAAEEAARRKAAKEECERAVAAAAEASKTATRSKEADRRAKQAETAWKRKPKTEAGAHPAKGGGEKEVVRRYDGDGVYRWHGYTISKGGIGERGSIYRGDPICDGKTGKGVLEGGDGSRYEGGFRYSDSSFSPGDYEGYGVLVEADGGRYEGEWRFGKRNGKGKYTQPDGSWYEGDWVFDSKQGRGTYQWKDGDRYEGEVKNGTEHGLGTYTWKSGNVYEGEWRNGKMCGRGRLRFADGTVKEGLWRDDQYVGASVGADDPCPCGSGKKFKKCHGADGADSGRNGSRTDHGRLRPDEKREGKTEEGNRGRLGWFDRWMGSGSGERPAGETKRIWLPGGEEMEMVWCPAGTFMMGTPSGDELGYNDETAHRVTLSNGFWMGKYPVTQEQWKAVMGTDPSHWSGPAGLPVDSVSWVDCRKFCEAAGGKLRLPTEAEWEYACRAGSGGRYGGTGRMDDMGWYAGNSGKEPHLVGRKSGNAWGLHDMHGNVWEWCEDVYKTYPAGHVRNPVATSADRSAKRVRRGGAWNSDARDARAARRDQCNPRGGGQTCGFRVCCDGE